eukprot:1945908-Amphidinium_carterae.2
MGIPLQSIRKLPRISTPYACGSVACVVAKLIQELVWRNALSHGRGPIHNLRLLADRLGWVPVCQTTTPGEHGQCFFWEEADLKAIWDSAEVLCASVASKREDVRGVETGLATPQLKLDGKIQRKTKVLNKDGKTALNAAFRGVWREARAPTKPFKWESNVFVVVLLRGP